MGSPTPVDDPEVPSWTARAIRPGPHWDRAVAGCLLGLDVIAMVVASTDDEITTARLSVGAVLLAVGVAALHLARRRAPILVVVAVVVGTGITDSALGTNLATQASGVTFIVAAYAVGSWARRWRWALALVVLATVVVFAGALEERQSPLAAVAVALAAVVLPVVAGAAARLRRAYLVEVEDRLRAAEESREARAREAVLAERTHLARELHDVVAHHVSLMGVQAAAARTALDRDGPAARRALASIEDASRRVVAEMGVLLDALRDDSAEADRHSQPGLHRLDALVADHAATGLAVEVISPAGAPGLPAGLDLSAYRIIEESLTNISRHSQAREATVRIEVSAGAIVVSVHDPGPPSPSTGGGSRGLEGMRERVALFGGELHVGPDPDGGFLVRAQLPLPAEVAG